MVVWCELALQETWFSIGVGVFERVYCDEVGLVGKRGGDRLLRAVWFHVFLSWQMFPVIDFVIIPMLFYCFLTPGYGLFSFFNGVRRSFLLGPDPGDFRFSVLCSLFLVFVLAIVAGYHLCGGGAWFKCFVFSMASGLIIASSVAFLFCGYALISGCCVGVLEMFNLVVFSAFLPISFSVWLYVKLGDVVLCSVVASYSVVCIMRSFFVVLRGRRTS